MEVSQQYFRVGNYCLILFDLPAFWGHGLREVRTGDLNSPTLVAARHHKIARNFPLYTLPKQIFCSLQSWASLYLGVTIVKLR